MTREPSRYASIHYGGSGRLPVRPYFLAVVRAVVCLFVAAILSLRLKPSLDMVSLLPYAVVSAAFLAGAVYVLIALSGSFERRKLVVEVWLDALLAAFLVYLTGGATRLIRL